MPLRPFQSMVGRQLHGAVTVDTRGFYYGSELELWIDLAVRSRMMPGSTLRIVK